MRCCKNRLATVIICYSLAKMLILLSTALIAILLSVGVNFFAETMTKPISLIGSFLTLRLAHNPGIAFSVLLPASMQTIIIISALILVIIVAMRTKKDRLSSLAFGLIIGGAISNLIDRIPDGVVTDYISVGTFPIFNTADSCICIGAGLLLLRGFERKPKRPPSGLT